MRQGGEKTLSQIIGESDILTALRCRYDSTAIGENMAEVKTVLTVGGGIAGLTLGRALRRQGFTVEVVERSTTWRAEGGGIMVHANGMRMLRALDLEAAVERAGTRVRLWHFCDQAGEILCESNLEALWGDVGPCIGIERMRLQQALVAGIEGVPWRQGTSIRSLTQHDERVSVTFDDGSSATYDLVVGADGISFDRARTHVEHDATHLHRRHGVAERRANPTAWPHQSAISPGRGLLLWALPGRRWEHLWLRQHHPVARL